LMCWLMGPRSVGASPVAAVVVIGVIRPLERSGRQAQPGQLGDEWMPAT
jgi:hypothetical protein